MVHDVEKQTEPKRPDHLRHSRTPDWSFGTVSTSRLRRADPHDHDLQVDLQIRGMKGEH